MSRSGILEILEIIVSSHLLLLGGYLIREKNRRNVGVKYLGVFLLLFGIHYLFISLNKNEFFRSISIIELWFDLKLWAVVTFSLGPILLITTQSYAYEDFKLSKWHLLHFAGYTIPLFHYTNPEFMAGKTLTDWTYLGITSELHNLSYSIISLVLTIKLKKDEFQNQRRLLLHLNLTYLILVTAWITFELVRFHGWTNNIMIEITFIILLLFLADGLIIICWKYPDTIVNSKYIRSRLKEWTSEKYQDSRVEDNYASIILDSLKKHIEYEKLYTNSELKLNSVSEVLGFPSKDISQVVNVHLSKSFNEYLNNLRIREASRLLTEKSELNVMEVMYQIGFNSKSLFFKYFKQEYGMTPFQYKKLVNTLEER